MKELDKALNKALGGELKKQALKAFDKQLKLWELVMPKIEPLVSDFGLGDFYKTGLIECWIANEFEAGYCGKYLFVFDGQECPLHSHKQKHETFFIVKGSIRMNYDNRQWKMKPGDVLTVETSKSHSFTGIGPALLLEISMPSTVDDNYFQNTQIPIGGNYQIK